MSLTTGRGPLSGRPAGRFDPPIPDHVVYVEPFLRRISGVHRGETVVDTEHALLVHRPGLPPVYALPVTDVRGIEGAPVPEVPGQVQVPWETVEEWYEEEERVHGHPRNPYHRVDCIRTRRHLRVTVGDSVLVDTDDTIGVYETALAPVLYVRPDQVRTDLLVPSATTTYCPYKGTTTYWNVVVDGIVAAADAAWTYEDPLPESQALRGMFGFEPDRVSVAHDLPRPAAPGP